MVSRCLCVPPAFTAGLSPTLSRLRRVIRRHLKLHGMLEGECVGSYGSGGYDPHIADPSESRALSSTLWELSMLLHHFHPVVAQCTAATAAIGSDAAAASVEGAVHALEPHTLADRYAYHSAGELCEVAGKPTRGQGATSAARRAGPAAGSPVVTALAAHYTATADVAQECGLDCSGEAELAGMELAGMFRCGPCAHGSASCVTSPVQVARASHSIASCVSQSSGDGGTRARARVVS